MVEMVLLMDLTTVLSQNANCSSRVLKHHVTGATMEALNQAIRAELRKQELTKYSNPRHEGPKR